MKVLLINPPVSFRIQPLPPLGIGYISAILEKEGHEVHVMDMPISEMDLHHVKKEISETYYELIGLSVVTSTYPISLKISSLVKQFSSSSKIMVGGPHPTFAYNDIIHENSIDLVVRYEGEITVKEIISFLEQEKSLTRVPGVVLKKGGHIFVNEDRPLIKNLDTLPFPARHLFPMERYRKNNLRTSILGSRGCPFHCSFCTTTLLGRGQYRYRNPTKVVDEIEEVISTYAFEGVDFVDDFFTLNEAWTRKICKQILKRKLEISWLCETRLDFLSSNLMALMKKSGCKTIIFGVESGDKGIRKRVSKNLRLRGKNLMSSIRNITELGIQARPTFILGLPGESLNSLNKTVELVRELSRLPGAKPWVNLFTPFPPLNNSRIIVHENDLAKFTMTYPVCSTQEIPLETLKNSYLKCFLPDEQSFEVMMDK